MACAVGRTKKSLGVIEEKSKVEARQHSVQLKNLDYCVCEELNKAFKEKTKMFEVLF